MKMASDARYKLARSCVYCSEDPEAVEEDSAYCHIIGMCLTRLGDCLDRCRGCSEYRPRRENVS